MPLPLASHDSAMAQWPARQLCFPTAVFNRISGFASHLLRWFAFSSNFFLNKFDPLRLNESDLPALEKIVADDGQGLLNGRI